MKKSEKNSKSNSAKGWKPNRLTAILGGIIAILLVALVILLILIPEEAELPIATDPTSTEAAATTQETEDFESVPLSTIVISGGTAPAEMLPDMAELYEQNSDIGGWIKIEDTVIDYPVMYTPEKESKYLYRTFDGKFKYRGELFIGAACTFEPETQTILIHGHNMDDGSMFNALLNYKSENYWKKHPTISFSTLYEERTYEIFAAFRDQIYDASDDVFRYYQFIDPQTEEEFNEGISYFMEKSTYDTGINVEYGDRLLMLSTCDHTLTDGRFVVVARLVTED